ncbi:hypothetical protein H0I29_02800 [Polaribacter sp. R2A056_3_33]|jgi:hypothetical protein|uniref:hypothetical protein n=1 Tax=Polaribacter sp. R2A056_3_33 TaxID=2745563 RepID=UPI001C4E5C98|nr:hypothetical protein [Polaribacter sp. R2A056_3_33]QXP71041.1 hypothetical protein H0I29_02800 [Polaribacter sp. R2A056_3_33]
MTTEFETEIVKTKEFNKIFMIVFLILYAISGFYIFMYDKESQNVYLKYLALTIYLSGIYFIFGQSFMKPKKLGKLKISTDRIEFNVGNNNKIIPLNELENIYLKYMDYGSWSTHSIFGNKNYLRITEKSGKKYDFEILIRNKNSKNHLKIIFNSPEFYEKFDYMKNGNSRTEF